MLRNDPASAPLGALLFMTRTNLRKVTQIRKQTHLSNGGDISPPSGSDSARTALVFLLHRALHKPTACHLLLLDLYVCGKIVHCFMLALWPRTPRGRRAPSFILLRVNCCDRALRGPSLALCPLRSKEAALILSVLHNLATQTRL